MIGKGIDVGLAMALHGMASCKCWMDLGDDDNCLLGSSWPRTMRGHLVLEAIVYLSRHFTQSSPHRPSFQSL